MNEEWQDIEIREKRNLKLEEKFEDEVDEDTALQPDDNLINVDTAEHTTGNDEREKNTTWLSIHVLDKINLIDENETLKLDTSWMK